MRVVPSLPLPAFALSSAVAALALIGCGHTRIYEDNPYTSDEVSIRSIAVAPFLIPVETAMTPGQPFAMNNFPTRDGATVYYSTEFAAEFAAGLTEFPDIEIIMPDKTERAWRAAEAAGTAANPMADAAQAMTLGRQLNADAILVADVIQWDQYDARLVLDWKLYYTRAKSAHAMDVRELERSGLGGALASGIDLTREPLFAEQLALDANGSKTAALLETYGQSLDPKKTRPYATPSDFVEGKAWPEFPRFVAWAALRNAYAAERRRLGR